MFLQLSYIHYSRIINNKLKISKGSKKEIVNNAKISNNFKQQTKSVKLDQLEQNQIYQS